MFFLQIKVTLSVLVTSVFATFNGREDVKFFIYTRNGDFQGRQVEIGDCEGIRAAGYNSLFPTKFVTHGYTANYSTAQVQLIKDSYLKRGDYNVIAVDWKRLAADLDLAFKYNHDIGQYIGRFIIFLTREHGTKLEDVHVIGHSLGGQLVGFVGDIIVDPKVGRVTGLDPSTRGPYPTAGREDRLDKDDAVMVDVFHTSLKGLQKPLGDVDFYPNGGQNQTGCVVNNKPVINCDHAFSWKYFADSILNPDKYIAKKCGSQKEAFEGNCVEDGYQMGENLLPLTRGIFFKKMSEVDNI